MLWQCSWLWPLDDSDSGIIMNYHELSAIRSPRMSFRIVPQISTIWFGLYHPHPPQQPMNNTSTKWVFWIKLHYVAFLQILVPGSETLPTSANICLLNQPLLSKPLLVVAVDIHLTCASLTQSGEGPRMGRQDSHSFVMLLFFVVMSYHVSDILLVRSVDAISSSLVCAKLTNSPGAPNPNFHKSTGAHISCKDKWESLRVNRDTVSKMYQKTTLRSFRNFGFIILDYWPATSIHWPSWPLVGECQRLVACQRKPCIAPARTIRLPFQRNSNARETQAGLKPIPEKHIKGTWHTNHGMTHYDTVLWCSS